MELYLEKVRRPGAYEVALYWPRRAAKATLREKLARAAQALRIRFRRTVVTPR